MDPKRTRGLAKLGILSLFCAIVAGAADQSLFSSVFLVLSAVAAVGAAAGERWLVTERWPWVLSANSLYRLNGKSLGRRIAWKKRISRSWPEMGAQPT